MVLLLGHRGSQKMHRWVYTRMLSILTLHCSVIIFSTPLEENGSTFHEPEETKNVMDITGT